jgi:RNA polymerase sigma-70 factor, ECF subfamily
LIPNSIDQSISSNFPDSHKSFTFNKIHIHQKKHSTFVINLKSNRPYYQMTAEEFKNTVIPFSRKLYPMLKRILKDEEETRDALQDLMLKLWKKRHELDNCENPNAYIIVVAKNYCFDLLKKKRPSIIGEKEEYRLLNVETKDLHPEVKEKFEHVHKSIEKLPEKYRAVIQFRDIDGFSFEEIKEMTGLEVPYIRVILSRARLKVKTEVEKIFNYEVGNEKQVSRQRL